MTKLAITGLGMVTSVGHDVITSCASMRCGLRRTSPSSVSTLNIDAMESIPIVTMAINGVTDGYTGMGLYGRILNSTMSDFMAYAGIPVFNSEFLKDTHFLLCLSPSRDFDGLEPDMDIERLKKILCKKISANPSHVTIDVCIEGNVSVLQGIQQASDKISRLACKRVLLIAIDSLVGEVAVNFFNQQNRLKSEDNPDGLIPGEAGVAIMVEDINAAQSRGANVQAYIDCVYSFSGTSPFYDELNTDNGKNITQADTPIEGKGLAHVVSQSLSGLPQVLSYYCDLNGESRRARLWGEAIPEVKGKCGYVPGVLVLPAESLGDTGAASAGIAVSSIVRSFVRGYNEGNEVLLWSMSDNGAVASAIIHQ